MAHHTLQGLYPEINIQILTAPPTHTHTKNNRILCSVARVKNGGEGLNREYL